MYALILMLHPSQREMGFFNSCALNTMITWAQRTVAHRQSISQHPVLLSPPLEWDRPNLPSLQCGAEGCSHRHAPTGCIPCCPFYSHPSSNTIPFPFCWPRSPTSSTCFFLNCEMEPFSITQCCWPALYFTRLFFFFRFLSLSLSLWLGAYLRGSAAGRLSTENPRPQQQDKKNSGKYSYSLAWIYLC